MLKDWVLENGPIPIHEEIVKPAAAKPIVLRTLGTASLMCALTSLMYGQQTPPPPEQPPAPQQQNPAATTAPPEISVDDPDYGEPLGVYFWLTRGSPNLNPGIKAAVPVDQILAMPDARPRTPGASISIPAGKFNHVEISYFQVDGNGTGYAKVPLSLFGSNFAQGDFLSTTYRIRSAQLTWNYLSWPAPPEDSKFRLRTLWSFNYTSASPVIDAPFEANINFTAAHATKNIFLPDFGVQLEYIPNKIFYFEARTWGFWIPHRADIADAEANLVVRIKHLEIFGGYKFFHLKTSPNSDQYFVGTLTGPLAGVRWVLK
jgi:hypothetical protein